MIDKLEFLIALARERHFGRAAEACGVSQPTLSSAIRQLEDILGAPLVERGSRFKGFTAEGERALEWARRIVGDTRSLKEDLVSMRRGLVGHLKLAVIPTALPMVSRLTTAFTERWPDVKMSIFSRNSSEALRLLENLEIDACLTYLDNEPLGRVATVPLYRERHHLVTAEGNPFSDRATVTWEEVATLPLCLLTPSMQNRRIIDRVFSEVGCRTEPLLETSSIVVIASHVRAGHWSTIMPRLMAEELAFPDTVKCIPIVAPEVANLVGLVTGHRDPQPPLTAALVAEARVLSTALSLRA